MSAALIMLTLDLVAMCFLVFAIYFPRHHRADLTVAFLGINVGVIGVCAILSSVEVSMGIGMGLFGVLSIIRLRSSEISQREIAYFFAALAIGLICGLSSTVNPLAIAAVVLMVLVLALADSQRLFGGYFSQEVVLDRAISDHTELTHALSQKLGAHILSATTTRLDLVNDTTWVQVRGRRLTAAKATHAHPEMLVSSNV